MPAKPKPANRDMPEDPRELAQAMFRYGDKQMKEKRAAENSAARRPVTPRQTTASR